MTQSQVCTDDNPRVVSRPLVVAFRYSCLSNELVDEGVDTQRSDGFCELDEVDAEQLKYWQRRPAFRLFYIVFGKIRGNWGKAFFYC